MLPGIIQALSDRFLEILLAPYYFRETLWMVIPILVTMLLMETYFGRYEFEDLGWNSAFGNSLVLIFVSIDLMRHIYNLEGWQGLTIITPYTLLVVAVIFEGILLTLTSFYHLLPRDFAFNLTSTLPINFIAYLSVILVYTRIPVINFFTILSSLVLLIIFALIIRGVKAFVPKVVDVEEVGKIKAKRLLSK